MSCVRSVLVGYVIGMILLTSNSAGATVAADFAYNLDMKISLGLGDQFTTTDYILGFSESHKFLNAELYLR